MTTALFYNRQGHIDYDSLCYNPDEPGPLPDAMYQDPILQEFLHILGARFTDFGRRPDNFLSSNTMLCYDRRNLNVRVQPDCYLAFGVDARAIRRRLLYLPWEAGKPPDFVLEIGSESTARQDVTQKRDIYARMGVPEYWLFDPSGGDYYGYPLVGERLVGGVYQPFDLTTEPDGVLKGYSPMLELYLCWYEEWLRFYDPATGDYLRNLPQERAARQDAEAARQDAEASLRAERAARQNAEAARQAERAAREADQARIRQLEEELRRRRMEN